MHHLRSSVEFAYKGKRYDSILVLTYYALRVLNINIEISSARMIAFTKKYQFKNIIT